jgi:hypothetical protein
MKKNYGICPVCNGSKRKPVSAESQRYKMVTSGYDPVTDTFPCTNCGGQYMLGQPSGEVGLRNDGAPCVHEYESVTRGRCYTEYTCKHCGDRHSIDSGD